jgi:hypothetical protein
LEFDGAEFRTAMRWFLGMPVSPDPFKCPAQASNGKICGAHFDVEGDHGVCCKFEGNTISRHNALCDLIYHMLSTCFGKSRVHKEIGMIPTSRQRPADIEVREYSCGRDMVLDVTCKHALQSSLLSKAATQAGVAAKAGHDLKLNKYQEFINSGQFDFLPLACETFGGWSDEAHQFFHKLCRDYAHHTFGDMRIVKRQLQQRLSVSIYKSIARAINFRRVQASRDDFALLGPDE